MRFGASFSVATLRGLTALHYAVCSGLVGMASYLIERGCAVDHRTLDGSTPLHLATAMLGASTDGSGEGLSRASEKSWRKFLEIGAKCTQVNLVEAPKRVPTVPLGLTKVRAHQVSSSCLHQHSRCLGRWNGG